MGAFVTSGEPVTGARAKLPAAAHIVDPGGDAGGELAGSAERVLNAGGYGYAIDDDTAPADLALVHMHIGGLAATGDPRPWANGELGTVARAAAMFSAVPQKNAFVKTVIPLLRRAR